MRVIGPASAAVPLKPACRTLPGVRGGDPRESVGVARHLRERCAPDVRRQLLVEELLQLECAAAIVRVRRVERRLRVVALQPLDDLRRVVDRVAVQLQDRERLPWPRVIASAHAMWAIGIGALRLCGTPL